MVESLINTLGIWYYIILNAFGVIAIIFKVIEFQLKKRSSIFFCAISSTICWLAYFLLQGDFVSTIISVVGVIQYFIFLQRDKHNWAKGKFWLILFISLQLLCSILTFKVWHDIFAVIAGVSATIAYFVLNKKAYRFTSLISLSSWVVNSIFKFYLVALLHDAFGTISVIVSIIRFDVLKRNDNELLNN